MSGIARATVSNSGKSASVLELAPIRKSGPRMDPGGRDSHKDRTLLDRLEAENRELRDQVIQLALQIQMLRRIGKSETRSGRGHAASASREARRRHSNSDVASTIDEVALIHPSLG
jgi:hypothetical protein